MPAIYQSIFNKKCGLFSTDPEKALATIKQIYEVDGQPVSISVSDYYDSFTAGIIPLMTDDHDMDLVSLFIKGLHPRIQSAIKNEDPNHNKPRNCDQQSITLELEPLLQLASSAEESIRNIKTISREVVTRNHSFLTDVTGSSKPKEDTSLFIR